MMRPFAALLLLSAVLLAAAGCQNAAILAQAVGGPEKTEALFVLPDEPTLVLVDDPRHLLDNPSLARQIGSTAVYYLTLHEALPKAEFVDPRELSKLEAQLDKQWPTTPIDEVGRRLGAKQVIYAKVTQVQFQAAEGLYRPEATLEVKVLDTADAKRLWPEAPPLPDPKHPEPGHRFSVKLDYETRTGRNTNSSTPDDLARRLADEAGLGLARIFYTWKGDAPGSSL